MGGEIAHPWEWDFHVALPWFLLEHAEHRGVQTLVGDLNRLYSSDPALYRHDFEAQGFAWIDCDDREHSTLAFRRHGDGRTLIIVLNFTPQPRPGHMVGVQLPGTYRVLLNSDSVHYGGANLGHAVAHTKLVRRHGEPYTLTVDLPPLAGLVLERID
jgi:1,4-alpha-glucan branching enzyme